jgi:hypothetical protein
LAVAPAPIAASAELVAVLDDCTSSVTIAPQNAPERRVRRLAENGAQHRSRQRLQSVGHHGHAEQEQPDAAENGNCCRHARLLSTCTLSRYGSPCYGDPSNASTGAAGAREE